MIDDSSGHQTEGQRSTHATVIRPGLKANCVSYLQGSHLLVKLLMRELPLNREMFDCSSPRQLFHTCSHLDCMQGDHHTLCDEKIVARGSLLLRTEKGCEQGIAR